MSYIEHFEDVEFGLSVLSSHDELLVSQQVELLEVATDWEQNNKYHICDIDGNTIFFLQEENSFCTRNCCGPQRPFDIYFLDSQGEEVLHLHRDCACAPCGWPCCFCFLCCFCNSKQFITINSFDVELGKLSLDRTCCVPTIRVDDGKGNKLYSISGSCCHWNCGKKFEYQIFNREGVEVGNISKENTGDMRERVTDADCFVLRFPLEIDVNEKAMLIAAVIMIDFLYFEF